MSVSRRRSITRNYKVKIGISYPDQAGVEKYAPVGTIVNDIPVRSVQWLLDKGAIEEVQVN